MAERSLIFTAESIRGLQRAARGEPGGKFQTRRIVAEKVLAKAAAQSLYCADISKRLAQMAPIQPGDVVRAKEAFQWFGRTRAGLKEGGFQYIADGHCPRFQDLGCEKPTDAELRWDLFLASEKFWNKTRSPMFMPRWASRWWFTVSAVRVQRLQDITEKEAELEGAANYRNVPHETAAAPSGDRCHYSHWHLDRYRAEWDRINGPGSWASNPWVYVYEWKEVRSKA